MATWDEFVALVGTHFPIAREEDDLVRIDFAWGDGRSHFVSAMPIDVTPPAIWLVAPICDLESATPARVLEAQRRGDIPIGVVMLEVGYALSHILPMGSLAVDEALARIRWIAELADEVEKDVLGGADVLRANLDEGGAPAGGGFCTGCGAARVPGAAFCGACGTRLA